MDIYKASKNDINELVSIYHIAVDHMYEENNFDQWKKDDTNFIRQVNNYIDNDCFYKVVENNEIIGFFAMIFGEDKTYNQIHGKWLNNDPYVTIHKIASKYYKRKIASNILDFVIKTAKQKSIYNIRIDTHNDNISMLSFLKKNNFSYCGIISITCDFNDLNSLRKAFIKVI